MRIAAPVPIILLVWAVALADPYGPPHAVTDMAPFCATCHASTSLGQLPDLAPDIAAGETIEEKHLKEIKSGSPYKDLTSAERATLLSAIRWVDEHAAVTIQAPAKAKRNSRVEVTVTTKGGAGPVVGVSLVDSAVRYQARPISSSGFKILGPPLVVGPDRKTQAQWIDRRVKGADMGLNTIMIFGVQGIAVADRVDETRTTWTLRTPAEPGGYTLAAAFYYGTEKAHALGTVIRNGRAEPRGGLTGGSGRIMFSTLIAITVY